MEGEKTRSALPDAFLDAASVHRLVLDTLREGVVRRPGPDVVRRGRTAFLSDALALRAAYPDMTVREVEALAAAPLEGPIGAVGYLVAADVAPRGFSAEDEALLTTLCTMGGCSIAHARRA